MNLFVIRFLLLANSIHAFCFIAPSLHRSSIFPSYQIYANSEESNFANDFDSDFQIDNESSSKIPIFYTEEEERACLPPTGQPIPSKVIMLISDSTGFTAKNYIRKSLLQFDSCDEYDFGIVGECDVQTRTFTFIRSETALAQIIKKAREKSALVVFTFAEASLRNQAQRMCELSGLDSIDLLGPTLDALSKHLNKPMLGQPMVVPSNRRVALSDDYFRRIEAVEFTLNADDGKAPWLLKEADIIIVGVSRTGKTPLSVVLSQTMGLKIANVPLVMECSPPKELLETSLDPQKVFCLTIAPSELRRIRTTRLERRGVKAMETFMKDKNIDEQLKSNYASRAYSLNDLKNARDLAIAQGWTEVDVTGRAVEETASYIISLMNQRFEDSNYSEQVFGN